MKREELIQQIRKAHNWERARGNHKLADLFGHVLTHLTDPTTITLQLPTYAPGDPKAGEALQIGDWVYGVSNGWRRYPTKRQVGDMRVEECAPDRLAPFWYPEFDPSQQIDAPYYSTAAARDAAMKAAEEAAKK